MKNRILKEQKEFYKQEDVDTIESKIVKDAVDSGCIEDYGKIQAFNTEHPINKKRVVQVMTDNNIKVDGVPQVIWGYITDRQMPNKTDEYTIDYFYKAAGKYIYIESKGWKCSRMGVKQRIIDALVDTKQFAKEAPDKTNWVPVEVVKDSQKPENSKIYSKVAGWDTYSEILSKFKTPIWLYKRRLTVAPSLDIDAQTQRHIAIFSGQGYFTCSKMASMEGDYATVNLHNLYPDVFGEDYYVCKEWSKVSTDKKSDCVGAIDGYYNEIIKYNTAPQRKPSMSDVVMRKNLVNQCIRDWSKKMPFRKKKINFLRELKPSHPYYLKESDNELTNIIRESLRIVKKRKNR